MKNRVLGSPVPEPPAPRFLNDSWQILRRSFAIWLKLEGADVKDAPALLRHARVQATLDIYQQFTPENQRRVVDRLGSRMVN